MNRRRAIYGFTIGAAILVLLAVAVVVPRWRETTRLVLPGGETVILRGVTYGTNHPAPDFQLTRRLPTAVRRPLEKLLRLKSIFSHRTSAEPRLVLWLEIQHGAVTNRRSGTSYRLLLEDEDGRAAGGDANLYVSGGASATATTVEFPILPRRSRRIGVVFSTSDYSHPQVLGRLEFPNPAHHSPPPWPAETLPATQENARLECTLERVVTGVSHGQITTATADGRQAQGYKAAKPGQEVRAALAARFQEDGHKSTLWTIGTIELADATGNVAEGTSRSSSSFGSTLVLDWSPPLWPDGTWEIRLNAKRTKEADFDASETLEFDNVEVPGLDQPVSLPEATLGDVQISGGEFTLRKPITGSSYSSSDLSELKFTVTGLTNGLYLDLIRAVDDQWRVHQSTQSGWSGSGGAREMNFGFKDIPADVKQLSVTLAVHRGRSFTFRVRPKLAVTNEVLAVR